MPTIAVICLALLSLLAGAMIEPPAARAAPKPKSAADQPTATARAPDYRVVAEEASAATGVRHVAIALPRRLGEADLYRIADAARATEKAPHEKTIVNFYLPGMKPGHGAWAVATYGPGLKLVVLGARVEDEQAALAEVAADRRDLLGAWLTAPPATPGRLTLYREGGRVFAEWRLRSGEKSVEALVESRDPKGRRFAPAAGGSDNYLVGWAGELEIRDGQTVIATAERIGAVGDKAAAAEKSAPTKSTAKPQASAPRARASAPASAAADTSRALSQRVFNF